MNISNSQTLAALTTFATLTIAFPVAAAEFRAIDGSNNNLANPTYGQANTELIRLLDPAYTDGYSSPAGADRPSARAISNAVSSQSGSVTNPLNASDWLWQWGQFLDHDLGLTESHHDQEGYNVLIPTGDPWFDPDYTGTQEIQMSRSLYNTATGTDPSNPRQQINQITSYLDASMVYGSDAIRAEALRTNDGTGKLKTSAGDLLPFNTAGLPNAGGTSETFFVAGDIRAGEQIGLTAVHTLFVREHNRLAEEIAADPTTPSKAAAEGLSIDDYIYETARKIVGAEIQVITYNEFLPLLLGEDNLEAYNGYDATVNASVSNEFAHAAFRVGHTMLSPELQRIDNDGTLLGSVALRDAFFNPELILESGIDSLLLGLASQKAQNVDTLIIDDVRNFLFGPPGSGGFDLASLNIQRGRDHGLPSYNQTRIGLGLDAVSSFAEITADLDVQQALASVYGSVDEIDLWIGGLAEDKVNNGLLGEVFQTIIADQFRRSRNGDRFFYLNDADLLALVPDIGDTTLADVIRRNSTITNIQDHAFLVAETVPEPMSIISVLGITAAGGLLKRRKGQK
ncbi:MAG: peroxidase family protein [Oscillatoria sp. PMC 1068.18]|nr:peroxidase family protein [Oscillatoria sp. PMC 1076.18]MEC4989066.1 peroxidase family protein [Oscillatoria sp. PMC 1068.18]